MYHDSKDNMKISYKEHNYIKGVWEVFTLLNFVLHKGFKEGYRWVEGEPKSIGKRKGGNEGRSKGLRTLGPSERWEWGTEKCHFSTK